MTNCKDSHTTYFPELHAGEEKWTKEELEEVAEDYNREQKKKRVEHQVEKYERLSEYSLDPENKKQYARKAEQWKDLSSAMESGALKEESKNGVPRVHPVGKINR